MLQKIKNLCHDGSDKGPLIFETLISDPSVLVFIYVYMHVHIPSKPNKARFRDL